MNRLGHVGTRRQLFRAMVLGAASVPFAMAKKSAAMGFFPRPWPPGPGQPQRTPPQPDPPGSGQPGPVHCLLKGTKISTPSGDRPVQDLQIGDEVHTLAGLRAIKWVGYNKFTKEEAKAWLDSVMPIRVARFAIDDHSPHSDLYLSPLHCIFFNEALIPVKYLSNGTSVAQSAPPDMSAIEYYHIEFDRHEVLYAEGALVESFFDGESEREYFSNFIEYERLYATERQSKMTPFAPIFGYRNKREKIEGVARSLISNIIDVRDPVQIAHDQIARRAEAMLV
jgi:Hint domain